jgi:non-ribosomal peptide synthetase component F
MAGPSFERQVTSLAELPAVSTWLAELVGMMLPGGEVVVSVSRQRRSTEQNARLWPMLRDVSRQVPWNGQRLTPAEYKDLFTAALKQQKLIPGLDGGLVVLGGHTSRMSKADFSDLIELITSFGAERGVVWSEDEQSSTDR